MVDLWLCLLCGCFVVAMLLLCSLYVGAMWLLCGYYEVTMWLPCGCNEVAIQEQTRTNMHVTVYVVAMVAMWLLCGYFLVAMRVLQGSFTGTNKNKHACHGLQAL